MKRELSEFKRSLRGVAMALAAARRKRPPRWGLAGFREESLVFLFAETLHDLGWTVKYEPAYDDGTRRRGDLHVAKDGEEIVIEAKWWWWDHGLAKILKPMDEKLKGVTPSCRTMGLVFTIDRVGVNDAYGNRWTPRGASVWLEYLLARERLATRWSLLGTADVPSRYRGTAFDDGTPADREGLLVSALFERKASRRAQQQARGERAS